MAARNHCAAVDMNAHIGINACICAVGAGLCRYGAAVYDQPAVGVDAVTFTGLTGDPDVETASVDRCDGNTILIGVDAIVAGVDVDDTAVDRQMQFAV